MADTLPCAGTPAAQKGSAVLKHIMLARVDSGFFTYLPYMLQFSAQYKIYQIHMLVCRTIECPYDGMPVDQNAQNRRINARMPIFSEDTACGLIGPLRARSSVPRPLLCLVTTQFSVFQFQLLRLAAR